MNSVGVHYSSQYNQRQKYMSYERGQIHSGIEITPLRIHFSTNTSSVRGSSLRLADVAESIGNILLLL